MDGYWEHADARVSEAWRALLIDGEHTLPDGSTIRRGPYRSGYRAYRSGHPVFPDEQPAPLPDFGSIYDLLAEETTTGHDAGAFLIDEVKTCIDVPCPPYVDITIRAAQPATVPVWVAAAIGRIEREWSDHLQALNPDYATAPGYRVTMVPALAGGYWVYAVPDEPPLMVETLCEECTGAGEAWPR